MRLLISVFCMALLAACSPHLYLPHMVGKPHRIGTYYFEGDEVVFEFDMNMYQYVSKPSGARTQLARIAVNKVALAGEFNDWSSNAWEMKDMGNGKYQLRKKVADFKDKNQWEFKYALNGGQYWAEPEQNMMPTTSVSNIGVLGWYEINNQIFYNIHPDASGNAIFQLKGHTNAQQVILAGTFNYWDENAVRMERTAEGWQVRLRLPPGHYEYKFIADGEWLHDEANPNTVINEHGTLNSVLNISREVSFVLNGYPNAQRVMLSGSFCDWNEDKYAMQRTPTGWTISLPLDGGKHLYKFIVDGEWVLDPANPKTEKTHDGFINSVVMVR